MEGTLNALGVLATAIGTGVLCITLGKKAVRLGTVSAGVAVGLLNVLMSGMCNAHGCGCGAAFAQFLVPSICIVAVFIFLAHRTVLKLTTSFVLVFISFGLSGQYIALVHSEHYAGRPAWEEYMALRQSQRSIKTIQELLLKNAAVDETAYASGRIEGSALEKLVPKNERYCLRIEHHEFHSLWHTPLTGLFGKGPKPGVMWYPGGPLKDGARGLEFREEGNESAPLFTKELLQSGRIP